MKYILLLLLLGTSCVSQNIVPKNLPKEPKIKEAKAVNVVAHSYSFILIGAIAVVFITGTKQR